MYCVMGILGKENSRTFKVSIPEIEERSRAAILKLKPIVRGFAIGPFWIFIGAWWCICHIGFFAKCFMVALAKTCAFVASMERWCAAFGSVAGFVFGWTHGRSELLAMVFGGLVGNGIYVVAKILLKVLPDPNSGWPELAKAKA